MAQRDVSLGESARPRLGWLLTAVGYVLVAYGAVRLAVVLGSVLTERSIRIGWLWDLRQNGPTREIIEWLILAVAPLIAGVAILRRRPQARSLAVYLLVATALLGSFVFVFTITGSPGASNLFAPIRQPLSPWHQYAGVVLLVVCAALIAVAGGPLTPPRPPPEITRPMSARAAPLARPVGLLLIFSGLAQFVLIVPADGASGGWSFDAWFILYVNWRPSPFRGIWAIYGPLLLFWSAGVGLATLVSGVGLFMRKAWARPLGLVTCAFGAWTYFLIVLMPYYMVSGGRQNLAILYFATLVVGFVTFLAFRPRHQVVAVATAAASPGIADIVSTVPDGEGWRDSLIRSLTADQVSEVPRLGRLRRLLGWPALIAGVLIIGIARISLPRAVDGEGEQALWVAAGALVVSLLLAPLLHFAARNIRRARSRGAVKELMEPAGRRPILYLRPFDIDVEISRPSLWEFLPLSVLLPIANAEETAVRELSRIGPVITIGRPGEPLPSLGAARFYVTDGSWRSKVADAASAAQLVLLVSGVSDGLRWEIAYLLRTVPMEKLILWAHPWLLGLDKKDREREWTFFRNGPGGLFPRPLPEVLGDARFFYFTAEGVPTAARSLPAVLGVKFHAAGWLR